MPTVLRDLNNVGSQLLGGAVTIGNFDGVHRGHAELIVSLRRQAEAVGGAAVVFTFDPHPGQLLRPDAAPPPLTWIDRRIELLAELGVDAVVLYPTDPALLSLGPAEFFERIVQQQLQARAVVEGPNFFFGRERSGDITLLRELCAAAEIHLQVVPPLTEGGQYVSSSRIRELIVTGGVAEAGRLLTRPYRIRGVVRRGAGRGAKLGFATANLAEMDTLLPAVGVYAGRAICEGDAFPAAINVGSNPTFGEQTLKVEVHLLDFAGALYEKPLQVDFVERLRDIRAFDSVDDLRRQLNEDVAAVRRLELGLA